MCTSIKEGGGKGDSSAGFISFFWGSFQGSQDVPTQSLHSLRSLTMHKSISKSLANQVAIFDFWQKC